MQDRSGRSVRQAGFPGHHSHQ